MSYRRKPLPFVPSPRYWNGRPPRKCAVCHASIDGEFRDARMRSGQWALCCPVCALGSIEQVARYQREASGRYRQT